MSESIDLSTIPELGEYNNKDSYWTIPSEDVKTNSDNKFIPSSYIQWSIPKNNVFIPSGPSCGKLPPGVYEIEKSDTGIYFSKIDVKTEGLLRFPQTNSDTILQELCYFWERESLFHKYDIVHKRGILLYGPPGTGKTSLIQLIMSDVVNRLGIVVKFNVSPHLFIKGIRLLREIEPNTPIVILMEDINSILEIYSPSEVLNILDGIDKMNKIVFLATTNYVEKLGGEIVNRPSRFDKRHYIGFPDENSRKIYLEYLAKGWSVIDNLEKWVKDTEGFSLAHLKELFVAVVILDDKYEDALKTISSMKKKVSSEDKDTKIGLRN